MEDSATTTHVALPNMSRTHGPGLESVTLYSLELFREWMESGSPICNQLELQVVDL
jgi:hypothetical protein